MQFRRRGLRKGILGCPFSQYRRLGSVYDGKIGIHSQLGVLTYQSEGGCLASGTNSDGLDIV
ncbi:hypothetical protein M426DRAFT_247941 [Hypoxylon sp. CI-4A]|nr:hypothetical protein M426DRAFT_247941 [Hypoxylon sp. CI-4A]